MPEATKDAPLTFEQQHQKILNETPEEFRDLIRRMLSKTPADLLPPDFDADPFHAGNWYPGWHTLSGEAFLKRLGILDAPFERQRQVVNEIRLSRLPHAPKQIREFLIAGGLAEPGDFLPLDAIVLVDEHGAPVAGTERGWDYVP